MNRVGESDLELALHESLLQRLRALRNSGVPSSPPDSPLGAVLPSCARCADTGLVAAADAEHAGSVLTVDCRSCDLANERRHVRLLKACRVPPMFTGVSIEDVLVTTPGARSAVAVAHVWAHMLDECWPELSPFANPALGSIFIVGGVGAVKSTLAAALFAYRMRLPHVQSAVWFKTFDLFQEIRRSWDSSTGGVSTTQLLESVRTADILVLDDLGVEEPYPWVLEYLYGIIDYRADYFRPTIFTSNLELEELEGSPAHPRLGKRIVSRLVGMVGPYVVHMDQPDMRFPRVPS